MVELRRRYMPHRPQRTTLGTMPTGGRFRSGPSAHLPDDFREVLKNTATCHRNQDAPRRAKRPSRRAPSTLVRRGAGGRVHHRRGHHARAVGSEKGRGSGGFGDARRNLQEIEAREPGDHLVFREAQPAAEGLHCLLDRSAVDVRGGAQADDPDARGAHFDREVLGQRFDRAERRADGGCSLDMAARRAAGQEQDDAGLLRRHAARRGARGDELRLYDRHEGRHEFVDRQLDGVLAVAILVRRGTDGVENDVDAAGLLRDGLDVGVNGGAVGSFDLRRVRATAVRRKRLAAVSTFAFVHPARKTSAPSAANSPATAAPIDPPAPNTMARLSFRRDELIMRCSFNEMAGEASLLRGGRFRRQRAKWRHAAVATTSPTFADKTFEACGARQKSAAPRNGSASCQLRGAGR